MALAVTGIRAPAVERVLRRCVEEDHGFRTACRTWAGPLNNGYGLITVGRLGEGTRRTVGAHRVAWEHVNGPIPEGYELDHLCRNRACCEHSHLEMVTHRENMLRSPVVPAAINAVKSHCIHGHELVDENVYLERTRYGHFSRKCRQCRDRWRREYDERKASA